MFFLIRPDGFSSPGGLTITVLLLCLQWAEAIDSLEVAQPGSDKSFGMQQRPDGDIEIDEKFWEQDFEIPNCHQCDGVLKPDVRFSLPWYLWDQFLHI